MKNIYTHSGALGLSILLPLLVVPIAALLGVAYSYADIYDPAVQLTVIVLILVAACSTAIPVLCAKVLKVRNVPVVMTAGLLTGLTTLYSSWVIFDFYMDQKYHLLDSQVPFSILDWVINPVLMWKAALAINETGWFTIGTGSKDNISGIVLWVCWGIEAVSIILLPVILAWTSMEDQVFCEKCGKWAKEIKDFLHLQKPVSKDVKNTLDQEGTTGLLRLSPVAASPTEGNYLNVKLRECPECMTFRTMAVENVTTTLNSKGKLEKSSKSLAKNILLEEHEYSALSKLKTAASR